MNPLVTTTPSELTEQILEFCRQLDPSQETSFVPVRPEPYARLTDCFFNVPEKTKRDGGRMQLGWIIWEMEHVLVEAEFHAVWVSHDGVFVDVTPKQDGEISILFHPDTTRSYNREPVDNIRRAFQDHPVIHEFINLHQELDFLKKKYMVRKASPGGYPLRIPPSGQRALIRIQTRLMQLQPMLLLLNQGS
ncbi:MAG: hypothetical protein WBC05_03795 [Sedimentisphaerales bacterium]